MAGYDDADGVRSVGEADGADGARAPDAFRKQAVADGFGGGNLAQCAPDFALEGGACRGGGDFVDDVDIAREVGSEASGEPEGIVLWNELVAALAVVDVEQTLATRVVIGPVDHAERAFPITDVDELADGRVERV